MAVVPNAALYNMELLFWQKKFVDSCKKYQSSLKESLQENPYSLKEIAVFLFPFDIGFLSSFVSSSSRSNRSIFSEILRFSELLAASTAAFFFFLFRWALSLRLNGFTKSSRTLLFLFLFLACFLHLH